MIQPGEGEEKNMEVCFINIYKERNWLALQEEHTFCKLSDWKGALCEGVISSITHQESHLLTFLLEFQNKRVYVNI